MRRNRILAIFALFCNMAVVAEEIGPYPSTYQPNTPTDVAIVGATIMSAEDEEFPNGTVIIRNGKIAAMGTNIPVPEGISVINAQGKWVTPGIIDIHSHIGAFSSPSIPSMRNGNEKTQKNTAEVWIEHSVWPQDPAFEKVREGGVTTINVLPGSANLFGGRSVILKNIATTTVQAMKMPDTAYGVKMACGENPINYAARGKDPFTRMGNMAGFRAAFIDAQSYMQKPPGSVKKNLELDTIAGILRGDYTVHIHCYRADEMAMLIDLSHEFNFKIDVFHHATQAYKITDLLAQENIAVATWPDRWGFKMEAYDAVPMNAAATEWAGVHTMLHSDSAVLAQHMNLEAAKAMAQAKRANKPVTRLQALRWITLNPAKSLGIDDRVGSLSPGKDADVVIWNEDPFSVYAKADKVFVDGVMVVDRDSPSAVSSDFIRGQAIEDASNE